jgi:hypothetical protein
MTSDSDIASVLAKLEAAEKAMASRPWSASRSDVLDCQHDRLFSSREEDVGDGDDADGIALLRNAGPALVAGMRALSEILCNEPDDIDERLKYLVVQVSRQEWADAQAALAALVAAVEGES